MTKIKDVYNVSFSGSPTWGSSTNTSTVGKTHASKTSVEEEDLFIKALEQQHQAVLEAEKQYHNKQNTFKPDSIVQSVVNKFNTRAKMGFEKYNNTLDRNDFTVLEWIENAQEELMDGILYLEKLKKTLGG